jgi:hypothetical protein
VTLAAAQCLVLLSVEVFSDPTLPVAEVAEVCALTGRLSSPPSSAVFDACLSSFACSRALGDKKHKSKSQLSASKKLEVDVFLSESAMPDTMPSMVLGSDGGNLNRSVQVD